MRFLDLLRGLLGAAQVPDVASIFFTDDSPASGSANSSTQVSAADADSEAAWRRHRFRQLYEAHREPLWRYCLRRAASVEEAEDALNETFVVAWRRLDDVPKGTDARRWLFGVARNQLRNGWRSYNRRGELRDRLIADRPQTVHEDDPDRALGEGTDRILAALSTLKERDQELLRLATWEELPHAQIAMIVGCSENAVAVRLNRARGRLAKALERLEKKENLPARKHFEEKVKGPAISGHVSDVSPETVREGGLG